MVIFLEFFLLAFLVFFFSLLAFFVLFRFSSLFFTFPLSSFLFFDTFSPINLCKSCVCVVIDTTCDIYPLERIYSLHAQIAPFPPGQQLKKNKKTQK